MGKVGKISKSFKFFLLFKNKISQELIFSYGDSSKYLFIK
ncbi:hypothetical protein MHA_2615 [Mannheimia haemolytica PHL213]|nr:hypothetical protein MHH_c21410 [Mannheimia haemolytica M42548]AGQ24571.1 hypothetical protein F382_00485 [Mannheimia haemolytica D153]AGQ40090.1 hypothetical protein J451_00455 [Mannheimia haemolytica D174]AGR75192.1 hypothetical protein N220_07720 [Mannheimia haemolytica USMARC_2286]EDN75485.1 hypothetical protein MHA_2615 [Mannheimia haemolytica PHL213]EPZ02616.1 hypothetical protein L279_08495 [Mannheimia haemolytica D38]EPZ23395.1 hypothetical protein L281_06410 [Mannheimia haemolytic